MDNKNIQCSLQDVSPENKEDVRAVVDLHLSLIGRGEIAQLGKLFLRKFCYELLIRDGLMKAAICRVNGKPAGFITFTLYSITFHRRAIRKHWLYISWLIFLSILLNPLVLLPLGKALRLVLSRHRQIDHKKEPAAEILAIGVLPEYRIPTFIHQTGRRIAEELFMFAVSYFRSLGLSKMDIFYYAFQKQTLLFYLNLGGKICPCQRNERSLYQISFDFHQLNI
jgi:ribosomal protein S18 acetylase RimI-like enzyme